MEPTLFDGDLLLVRRVHAPRAGELAVVRLPAPRPTAVKRLLRQEPSGWWVERDNPKEGVDSWSVGVIAREDVIAQVFTRIWPIRRR
jgi:phage repressor protein C with HTH and peptisase S24 domain